MREIDPQQVEVQILGRVLEGHGAISSDLAEQDFPAIAESLRQSIDRVQQTEYSSCVDGRQTIELASGDPEILRPRKAGGGLTPFVMRGLASPEFRRELRTITTPEELYSKITEVNYLINRRESAHASIMPDGSLVFDCGAAGKLVEHVQSIATATEQSPNIKSVLSLVGSEIPPAVSPGLLLRGMNTGGKELGEILLNVGWDGEDYVRQLMQRDPQAVELLKGEDNSLHGHDEKLVALVDEDMKGKQDLTIGINKAKLKELTGLDAFVINVNEFRRSSGIMASTRASRANFIISNLAYQTEGVYKNLADGSHPVFYLKLRH